MILVVGLVVPVLAQDDEDEKRRDHLVIRIGQGGEVEQLDVILPTATPRQVQRTMAQLLAYMACMDNGGEAGFCSAQADSTLTRSHLEITTGSPVYGGPYPAVPGYSPGYVPDTSINNPFNIQHGYSRTEEELYQQYEYNQAQREEMERVRARAVEDAQVDILREVVSGQAVLEERVQATDQRLDQADQRLEAVAGQIHETTVGLSETLRELDETRDVTEDVIEGQQTQIDLLQEEQQKKKKRE
ncbi:MAG: hypothetical protein ABIH67_00800 [Candidatus Uhrbacteria bacterium]